MNEDRRWRALLERTRDVVTVLDESGTITYENRATERVLGYDPDERVGTNAFEQVHPDDREAVIAAFESVKGSSGETPRVEHRYRTADGEWRWVESTASDDRDIGLGGYVVVSRDVTERRRVEAAVRERERRLTQIAEHTRDVLWLFDADFSETLFVNSRVEEVYGVSVADLEADPLRFLDTVHPDDRERVEAAVERLVAGESVDMEYRVNPGEAYGRWVWVQGVPVREGDEEDGGDGSVVSIAGFSRDVTERKASQRRLTHQNEQLTLLNRVVRHEIRNDVSIVLGWVEELYDVVPADRRRDLARLVEAGEHVVELTHALEAFTKALDDDRPMRIHDVDLLATLAAEVDRADDAYPHATVVGPRIGRTAWRGAVDEPDPIAPTADGEIDGRDGDDDGRIGGGGGDRTGRDGDDRAGGADATAGDGYPDYVGGVAGPEELCVRGGPLLSIVFRNLLNNAVQHNEGDPGVEVSVEVTVERVVVRIADDGPGLPTTETARLLGRDDWGIDDDGTGVGLHMVDLVVGAYGGDVRFRFDAAPGAVVEVELRRVDGAGGGGSDA